MSVAVVFGGAGFVGSFFSRFLIDRLNFSKIYILDKELLSQKKCVFRKEILGSSSCIEEIACDVRNHIDIVLNEPVSLIANFAAIHREPGHENYEYYGTNILGAENVCKWAETVGCNKIIFTSSISPYGPSEESRDEKSLTVPTTAYGGSKLVAEKIHQIWQAKDDLNRRLVIVRPGVVFGPGEGGNVSRLIKSVLHKYFFYMGNQNTRKAGVYVKELCNAMLWVLDNQDMHGERVSLFNMSMNPGPSIQEYVEAVCTVAGVKRYVPGVPYPALLFIAYLLEVLAKPFKIKHPFSPVRIRKLVRSNNILPNYLVEHSYPFTYSLESAFEDWKKSCPEEWC